MKEPKLEFYVPRLDRNTGKAVMYNIFDNSSVYDWECAQIRKYLRAPSKYTSRDWTTGVTLKGFEAFCHDLNGTLRWQFCSRCEYEMSITAQFVEWRKAYTYVDVYSLCLPNIETIAHTILRQYKEYLKEKKNEKQQKL